MGVDFTAKSMFGIAISEDEYDLLLSEEDEDGNELDYDEGLYVDRVGGFGDIVYGLVFTDSVQSSGYHNPTHRQTFVASSDDLEMIKKVVRDLFHREPEDACWFVGLQVD